MNSTNSAFSNASFVPSREVMPNPATSDAPLVRLGGHVVGAGGRAITLNTSETNISQKSDPMRDFDLSALSAANMEPAPASSAAPQFVGAGLAHFQPSVSAQAPVSSATLASAVSQFDDASLLYYDREPHFRLEDQNTFGASSIQSSSTLEMETLQFQLPQHGHGETWFFPQQSMPQPNSWNPSAYQSLNPAAAGHSSVSVLSNASSTNLFLQDQSSNHSAGTSGTPSPKPTFSSIPPNCDYAGPHGFSVTLHSVPMGQEKKTPNWTFSSDLNRLYCRKKSSVPIGFRCAVPPPDGSRIQCMAVFSEANHVQEHVTRCPNHVKDDALLAHGTHFVRAEHAGAVYGTDHIYGRECVTLPYESPQPGTDKIEFILTFMCNSSCTGAINRRETNLVFTLLSLDGSTLGRAAFGLRVCASPGRDRGKDEAKKPSQVATLDRKEPEIIATEFTTYSVRPVDHSPPPSKKRKSNETETEEPEEIYTITTRYREDYELLMMIKQKLDLTRLTTEEQRAQANRVTLNEVSHATIFPRIIAPPPIANGPSLRRIPPPVRPALTSTSPSGPSERKPDSTTNGRLDQADERIGEKDENLNAVAFGRVEENMETIGVEEDAAVKSQPFTFIKDSESRSSASTEILPDLYSIFDNNSGSVFDDGGEKSTPSVTKAAPAPLAGDDNNNSTKTTGVRSIAEWLSSFGMIAYTDDFAKRGFKNVEDLNKFDRKEIEALKLAPAHAEVIWRKIEELKNPVEAVSAPLARMELRGMSRFKKDTAGSTPTIAEPETEAMLQTQQLAPAFSALNRRRSGRLTSSQDVRSLSQPTGSPPRAAAEAAAGISSSQPAEGRANATQRHVTNSLESLSRSFGSLSKFLQDQVGSFGVNSSQGSLGAAGRSGSNLASVGNGADGPEVGGCGVIEVKKFTFKHSFSVKRD